MITPYSNIISVTTLEALLLDTYSGAAAAYSLRKLSAAYTGSAIRVRRASDNTEQDIGFVDNELDTSALTTFCSGTDGFVETWYDQSGNARNATQSTASNQPQIVSSGSVLIEGIKPSFLCNQDSFSIPNSTTIFNAIHEGTSQGTIFATAKVTSNATIGLLGNNASNGFANGFEIRYIPNDTHMGFTYLNGVDSRNLNTWTFNEYTLLYNKFDAANATLNQRFRGAVNGSADYGNNLKSSAPRTGDALTNLGIGNNGNNSIPFIGSLQEVIIYISDQSSNRTGIETNINDFYSIY